MENQTKDNIFSNTSGIWKDRKIDDLEYVRKLRDEWKQINPGEIFPGFRNVLSICKQR